MMISTHDLFWLLAGVLAAGYCFGRAHAAISAYRSLRRFERATSNQRLD